MIAATWPLCRPGLYPSLTPLPHGRTTRGGRGAELTRAVTALLPPALLAALQQNRFQTMSDAIVTRIDEMGGRVDDLEKSIAELINQVGDPRLHGRIAGRALGPPRSRRLTLFFRGGKFSPNRRFSGDSPQIAALKRAPSAIRALLGGNGVQAGSDEPDTTPSGLASAVAAGAPRIGGASSPTPPKAPAAGQQE